MSVLGCELSIDGDAKTVDPYLSNVVLSESLDRLDALVAEVRFPMSAARDAVLKLCKPGVPWKLKLEGREAQGDIVAVGFRQTQGAAFAILTGLEKLHRLRGKQVAEMNEKTKDKIAKTLIETAGATAQAQAVGAEAKPIVIFDEDALGLLKKMADERNYALRFDGKKLQFAARNTPAGAAVKIAWESGLSDLRLDMDLDSVVTEVEVHGRDYVKGSDFKFKAAAAQLKKITGADTAVAIRNKAFGAHALVLDERLWCSTNGAVKERATAEIQGRAERFLRGSFVTDGNPELMPGKKVELTGAPWPWMGPFLIREVNHSFGGAGGGDFESTVHFFSDSMPKA